MEQNSEITDRSDWEALTEVQLSRHLSLSEGESCSLQTSFEKAGAKLCFTVEKSEDKNVVILRQTGPFDWWNRLSAKVSVGYQTIVRVDGEPRLQRICVKCASLSGLRQALKELWKARMKSTLRKKGVRHAVESVSTWHSASAIVLLQTLRCNLKVRGRYVGWCQPDMKHEEGFNVDGPVCISPGVALRLNGTSIFVKIDDGLMLKLANAGQYPRNYEGKSLLCAQPKPSKFRNSSEDNERNSDVSVIFLDCSEDARLFSVSPVSVYLH